jgi:hypothetical protein
MAGHRIHLPGFRLDKHGRLVRDVKRLDVSTRLKQAGSKRVRVVPPRASFGQSWATAPMTQQSGS